MHWLAPEVGGLLKRLLGVPDEVIRTDVPAPLVWDRHGPRRLQPRPGVGTTAVHLNFAPLSFQKQPATKNPRLWAIGALGALAVATTATTAGRRSRRYKGVWT
jgi:hypothetical protein